MSISEENNLKPPGSTNADGTAAPSTELGDVVGQLREGVLTTFRFHLRQAPVPHRLAQERIGLHFRGVSNFNSMGAILSGGVVIRRSLLGAALEW